MPYHEWGDETFDWNSLYAAERLLCKIFRLFRIGAHTKEKYGSIRASIYFWDGGIHSLIWPGYVRVVSRFLYFKIDRLICIPITKYTGIHWLGVKLQMLGYGLAYYLAMKKYSHIKDEICYQADYPELIPGGKEIHDKYWRKM